MDRVIFCPDESLRESAEELARSWALPIQIGHSARTQDLDFDANQVSLLTIPVDNYVDYLSPVNINEMFVFSFIDDFNSCKDVVCVLSEIDDDGYISRVVGEMSPNIQEEHRVVIKHRFIKDGAYLIKVMRNGTELCKNEIIVENPQRR